MMKVLSSTSICNVCKKDGLFLSKDESGNFYISCCLCGTIFFKFKITEHHNDQLPIRVNMEGDNNNFLDSYRS